LPLAPSAVVPRSVAAAFGVKRTVEMRALLHAVAATDLGTTALGARGNPRPRG